MSKPDDYPDYYEESIFAHTITTDGQHTDGDSTFVFTRSRGRLRVYALQYVGRHPDGDLMHLYGAGTISDQYYDPSAEDSFTPEDMSWDQGDGRPRLSQPVRRWLESRDYVIADPGPSLEALAHEKSIDLG